jgi:hypothetical protein
MEAYRELLQSFHSIGRRFASDIRHCLQQHHISRYRHFMGIDSTVYSNTHRQKIARKSQKAIECQILSKAS